jgi:hypothetical protein
MSKAQGLLMVVLCVVTLLASREARALGEGDPILLSIDLAGEYTDNRDSVRNSDKEDTFDFFVTPKLQARYRAAQDRTVLNFSYAPSYRYRSNPSDTEHDSTLQHDLGLEFKHRIVERWQVRAKEQFNYTDDPAVVDQGITVRRDSSFILNRAELETAYRVAPMTDVSVMGQHYIKAYEKNEVAEESDEHSYLGRLRLWTQFVPELSGFVDVQGEKWDYDSDRGLERGFTAWSGGLGIRKDIGAILSGQLEVGWKSLSYDDGELGDETAPYVGVLLHLTPVSDQLTIQVNGSYALRNADVYPYASQEFTGAGLDVGWRFRPRWIVGVGGSYRHGEYSGDTAPVEHTDPTYVRPGNGSEDAYGLSGRLGFSFDDTTSIQIAQTYENVDTDLATTSAWPYTRNATRLTFTKQF